MIARLPPPLRAAASVAALALALAGCAPVPPAAPAASTSGAPPERISQIVDDWHDAASKADETRYFAHFAEGAVFLGTDAAERWTVPQFRAYAHPRFAAGKAWRFRAIRRAVTVVADVAWFDEDLETERLGPARGTGVLVRDGGTWKIAHYDLSIPIPNERFAAVRALLEAEPPAAGP